MAALCSRAQPLALAPTNTEAGRGPQAVFVRIPPRVTTHSASVTTYPQAAALRSRLFPLVGLFAFICSSFARSRRWTRFAKQVVTVAKSMDTARRNGWSRKREIRSVCSHNLLQLCRQTQRAKARHSGGSRRRQKGTRERCSAVPPLTSPLAPTVGAAAATWRINTASSSSRTGCVAVTRRGDPRRDAVAVGAMCPAMCCSTPTGLYPFQGDFCRCCGERLDRRAGTPYCNRTQIGPCPHCKRESCGPHFCPGSGKTPLRFHCEHCGQACANGTCPQGHGCT